jgi:NaMN:DMB phosphoribosyltransferase
VADIEESLESSSYAVSAMLKQQSQTHAGSSKVEPREAYNKIREKMLELEIERDEQQKALELLKEVRDKERHEAKRALG